MFRSLLLLLCAFLGACSVPKRTPNLSFTESARAKETIFFVTQQEIEVDKPDINAGGGLIGAIVEGVVESNMDKNRQAAIVPIRDAMLGFDFESEFKTAMMASFPASQFVQDQSLVQVRNADDMLQAHVQRNGQNFGFMSLRYAFSSNFAMLYVESRVQVGDLGLLSVKGKVKPKYIGKAQDGKIQRVVYYSVHPLAKHGKFGENVERWSESNGKLVREALTLATEEIADLLKRDFATPLAYNAEAKQSSVWIPWVGGASATKASIVESRQRAGNHESKQNRVLAASGNLVLWTERVE